MLSSQKIAEPQESPIFSAIRQNSVLSLEPWIARVLGFHSLDPYYVAQNNILLADESKYPEFLDGDKNTLLMAAVKYCRPDVVIFLLEFARSVSHIDVQYKNRLGQNLLQIKTTPEISAFIQEKFQFTLDFTVDCPFKLSTFVHEEKRVGNESITVTPKGIALLLNYHFRKRLASFRYHAASAKLFERAQIVIGDSALVRMIKQFVESNEEKLLLIHTSRDPDEIEHAETFSIRYAFNTHHKIVYLEKKEGITHIILLDSFVKTGSFSQAQFRYLAALIKNTCPKILPYIQLWMNATNQQVDLSRCPFFAIKNATLIARYESFVSVILSRFTRQENFNGTLLRYYQLPAIFMHLASLEPLETYMKENPNDSCCAIIRTKKDGQQQTLQEYAFTKREGTPTEVPNKHYNPLHPVVPPTVLLPRTIKYFKRKYIELLSELFKQNSQEELRNIITAHDARHFVFSQAPELNKTTEEKKPEATFSLAKLSSFAPANPLLSNVTTPSTRVCFQKVTSRA